MSKALFRWLRGEINGYYLTNIYYTLNSYTNEIKNFLAYFKNMQFTLEKISDDDLRGIGKFAGIFLPRLAKEDSISSIRLTESEIVAGEEVSDSGLFNTTNERFDFSHVGTSPDINENATPSLRSSLVGNEAVVGYIAEDEEDVIDDNGLVRSEKYTSTPPANKAYSNFYGNQFLFLSEATIAYENLEKPLYIELYKTMQWVRYNGMSVESLARIIGIVCPNRLVTIDSVSAIAKRVLVQYTFNDTVDIDLKQQRLDLLYYIVNIKFPQVTLVESV